MVKVDYLKYLVLGASGVVTSVLANRLIPIDWLSKVSFLTKDYYGITLLGVLAVSAGIGLAEQLFYKQ